jgi:hypothetical protein
MQKTGKKKSASPGLRHNEHGEGNYKAAREYDSATKAFAKSGKVEPAARAAQPRTTQERREMEQAEAAGKSRGKGEDPALRRAKSR